MSTRIKALDLTPPPKAVIEIFAIGGEIKVTPIIDPGAPESVKLLGQRVADIAIGHPKTLPHLVNIVREYMKQMSPEQRLDVMQDVARGWCPRCGGGAPCACNGGIVAATSLNDIRS